MKYFSLIVFSLFLLVQTAHTTTWQTAHEGIWINGNSWIGGIAPPESSSDTFIISHPIIITSNIFLNGGAYMQIDSTGGICGHVKMTVAQNAAVEKSGILELDSLDIPGGQVNCVAPKPVILSYNAHLSIPGASLSVNGCGFFVGPWFECLQPEYLFQSVDDLNDKEIYDLSFNYDNGSLHIFYSHQIDLLKIYDITGKEIYLGNNIEVNSVLDIQLSNGIFIYEAVDKGMVIKGKFSVVN